MVSNKDINMLMTHVNPIILMFIVSEQLSNLDNRGVDPCKDSPTMSLCSSLKINGISKMNVVDYEPFLKPEISRQIYNYLSDKKTMLKKAKLETLNTIVFLFNLLMDDYKLQDDDIVKIKVRLLSL